MQPRCQSVFLRATRPVSSALPDGHPSTLFTSLIAHHHFFFQDYAAKPQHKTDTIRGLVVAGIRNYARELDAAKGDPEREKWLIASRGMVRKCLSRMLGETQVAAPECVSYLMKLPMHHKSHQVHCFRQCHFHTSITICIQVAPLYFASILNACDNHFDELAADGHNDPDDLNNDWERLPETRKLFKDSKTGEYKLASGHDDYCFRQETDEMSKVSLYNFTRRFYRSKGDPKTKKHAATIRFEKEHPLAKEYYLARYQDKSQPVPWIIGPSVPRKSKDPEKHGKLSCLLFKPFRTFADLKDPKQSWEDAWEAFLPTLRQDAATGVTSTQGHDANVSLGVLLNISTISRGLEVMSEERRVRAEAKTFIQAASVDGTSYSAHSFVHTTTIFTQVPVRRSRMSSISSSQSTWTSLTWVSQTSPR